MAWPNLGLAALAVTLVALLLLSWMPNRWRGAQAIAPFGLQFAGIVILTWALVGTARGNLPPPPLELPPTPPSAAGIVHATLVALGKSAILMALATGWGTAVGLGAAVAMVLRRGRYRFLVPVATVMWVIPTFLLAIMVQELQVRIYGATGVVVTGGYGGSTALQVFWAALVLGIRPAAYVFRQVSVNLEQEVGALHVRTALAKGLTWRAVVRRHIVRPALAGILSAWVSSFRLMIGSLPLVEFFFAFPGLGQSLLLALGLTYGIQGYTGSPQPDLAVALVVAMAALLVIVETGVVVAQAWFDPRLQAVRAEAA